MTRASRAVRAAVLLALAAPLLAGCSSGAHGNHSDLNSGANGEISPGASLSSADVMFAQMMIPHHQQAVAMGNLAETRASSPEVKALAASIKAEQAPEIALMKSWLKAANAPLQMDHSMVMAGLLTDADMKALAEASGVEFDRLFLEGMIGHHEGAIEMARVVLDSNNAEVKGLAEAIVASQSTQIGQMHQLLQR